MLRKKLLPELPKFYFERYRGIKPTDRGASKLIKRLAKKYRQASIAQLFGVSRQYIFIVVNHKKIEKKYKRRVLPTKKLSKKILRDVKRPSSREFQGREYVREIVRIRDSHQCQDCGKIWVPGQRRFDVHHLNGLCGKKSRKYDKILDHKQLITLCHKCHFNQESHTLQRKKKLSTS